MESVGREDAEGLSFILISVQKSGTDMLSQALGIYDGEYLQIDGMVDPADHHPHPLILDELGKAWPRDIARSHMHYDIAYLNALKARKAKVVFVYRDPRDTIVSWMYWIKTKQAMGWFNLEGYKGEQETLWDIIGVSRFHFSRFLGWLEDPYVHTIRFEELVQNRIEVLDELSSFLGRSSAKEMSMKIDPRTSTTFRNGIPGEWKSHFTPDMKYVFFMECIDVMEAMGYE